jgi:DNA-binding ferritin-like protein (Dps family)
MTTKTREQIQSICKAQWELRGIEPAAVLEMHQELSAHLDDALADGKSPTDVVGDDVQAFAASWARARKPRSHRLYRLTLDVSSLAVLLLAFAHLRRWSTQVPVLPGLVLSFAVGIIVLVLVERRRGDLGFWKGSLLFVVFSLAGLALNDLVFREAVLMTMPLWFTAPATLLVIARIAHDMRQRAAVEQGTGPHR